MNEGFYLLNLSGEIFSWLTGIVDEFGIDDGMIYFNFFLTLVIEKDIGDSFFISTVAYYSFIGLSFMVLFLGSN